MNIYKSNSASINLAFHVAWSTMLSPWLLLSAASSTTSLGLLVVMRNRTLSTMQSLIDDAMRTGNQRCAIAH